MNGLIVASAVARHLGPTAYGALAVAAGTVAVFAAAAGMGADHINIAELSRPTDRPGRVLATAVVVRLSWATFIVAVLAAFLLATRPANTGLHAILACTVPLTALSVLGSKLQADGMFVRYTILSVVALLVGATIRVAGVAFGMGIHYFAWAAVVDAVVMPALMGFSVANASRAERDILRPDWTEARRYLLLCLPTAISAALVGLYLRIELLAISEFLGKKSAGIWAAAGMFLIPWSLLASSILPVANRHLIKGQLSPETHAAMMVRLIRMMGALAVAALVINVIAARLIVPLVLGAEYTAVNEFVWITSLALIPLNMGSLQDIWIAHRRTTATVLAKVVVGLPLSYGLLALLAPRLGLRGAAAGMVLSYFSSAILFNAAVDRAFLRLQLRALGVHRGG